MDLGLKGKVAVITGGSEGIGRAAAQSLGREGASVVVCARRGDVLRQSAAEVAEATGAQIVPVQADVTVPADVERVIQSAVDHFGRLDILVNNAGTSAAGSFESITDDAWQADLDLKLFGAIRATPELINDPAAFQKFVQAQNQLQSALSRLLLVAENYPNLKADALFRDLQSQLEGTENRIAVARNRYIKSVQDFNTTVRQFPTNLTAMVFKMDVKPNFTVADEGAVSTPPKVDFGKPPAAAPAPAPKS